MKTYCRISGRSELWARGSTFGTWHQKSFEYSPCDRNVPAFFMNCSHLGHPTRTCQVIGARNLTWDTRPDWVPWSSYHGYLLFHINFAIYFMGSVIMVPEFWKLLPNQSIGYDFAYTLKENWKYWGVDQTPIRKTQPGPGIDLSLCTRYPTQHRFSLLFPPLLPLWTLLCSPQEKSKA